MLKLKSNILRIQVTSEVLFWGGSFTKTSKTFGFLTYVAAYDRDSPFFLTIYHVLFNASITMQCFA